MANEKRLIDANAWPCITCGCLGSCSPGHCEAFAEWWFSPVDAVEVVHGRWEQVDHDGSWRVDMCSICHRRMHYVDYDQPYQYCPNCGAKMDGGKADGV